MAFVLGLNAKTYENTGTYGTPVWVERTNVRSVTINLETATADITTRGGNGFRQVAPTLSDGSVEFEMVYDTADALFTNLKDAYLNRTLVDMAFADGVMNAGGTADVGTTYFRAEYAVTNFSISQGLEEAMSVSVTLQAGFSSNPPGFTTIV